MGSSRSNLSFLSYIQLSSLFRGESPTDFVSFFQEPPGILHTSMDLCLSVIVETRNLGSAALDDVCLCRTGPGNSNRRFTVARPMNGEGGGFTIRQFAASN